jgi:hypothetical protein
VTQQPDETPEVVQEVAESEPHDVDVRYERDSDLFRVTAKLNKASIVVENRDEESYEDLVLLVNALPDILNTVTQRLAEADAKSEASDG